MYKSAVKTYIITLSSLILILLSIIYISDPYMLFHKHWVHCGKMYGNMRIQDYGLIKFGDFDGIIIGTSMFENTSAKEAGKKLNIKFANLSISGGSFYERFKILEMAFRTRPFRHVIMSLDYKFNSAHKIEKTFEPALYSQNPLKGKVAIYSTDKALKCIFQNKSCNFINLDIDHPKAWLNMKVHRRRFGGFENWLKYAKKDKQIKDAFKQLLDNRKNYSKEASAYQQIINEEILPLFRYKKTQFSIIIPPYSALWWAKRRESIDNLLKPYQYLVEQTADMPNVRIYWFYDEDFVFDVTKYKDLTHYHASINSMQLDSIKEVSHVLNKDNYRQKIKSFRDRINEFDIQRYINQISNI